MVGLITRTHFLQTKRQFNARGISAGHSVRELPATPGAVIGRVSRIPWNWINKEIYDDDLLSERIGSQRMRLFDFIEAGKEIGYCIAMVPERHIRDTFLKEANPVNPIEIENIALFPEHAGNGRGRSVVKLMTRHLFEQGYDPVYLNSSDTNFPTLPDFYKRIGMTNLGQDQIPDFNVRVRAQALKIA